MQGRLPITTHDMRPVQELFPRTIVMDDGNIMADGLTDGDTGERRVVNGTWVGEAVSF